MKKQVCYLCSGEMKVMEGAGVEYFQCGNTSCGPLTFGHFGHINMERHLAWPGATGTEADRWTLADAAVAVAGEAGEVCEAVKKLRRLEIGMKIDGNPRQPKTMDAARLAIAKEIGDTITYLDLLAQAVGYTTEECTRLAFNGVSEREGMDYRI